VSPLFFLSRTGGTIPLRLTADPLESYLDAVFCCSFSAPSPLFFYFSNSRDADPRVEHLCEVGKRCCRHHGFGKCSYEILFFFPLFWWLFCNVSAMSFFRCDLDLLALTTGCMSCPQVLWISFNHISESYFPFLPPVFRTICFFEVRSSSVSLVSP